MADPSHTRSGAAELSPAASALVTAARTRIPCEPIRSLLIGGTIDDAYSVQQEINRCDPTRQVTGRKIGLTSPSVQQQMGVDRPDFGVLFADTACNDGDEIGTGELIQPRVEAEVAFVLGHDLPERQVEIEDVVRATAFVVAALEIVDSRIRNWDIGILDTVADNASTGKYVLGRSKLSLTDIDDLRRVQMVLRDDAGDTLSSGTGADCLGSPLSAFVWLANELFTRGVPLRAGEVVLSGSLGPLVPVVRGTQYTATISELGSVQVGFAR